MNPELSKMASGRWAGAVRNGAQGFFPGERGRDGAQIEQMPFWGLRKGLSAGKYIYHEESLDPDSILKSRTNQVFKHGPFLANIVNDLFCLKNRHTK